MSQNEYPILRRWDGKSKEAAVWDRFHRDSELVEDDANCFVYLSGSSFEQKYPAFAISFQRLVSQKCQPLIRRAVAPEPNIKTYPTTQKSPLSPRKAKPRQTCSLYLVAPEQLNESEAIQYHVTTRNFFAWLLEKPIVGPDPVIALLALKVRMDIWRDSPRNNFSALHHYAKAQGYGDLGDMQTYLARRLNGQILGSNNYRLTDKQSRPRPVQRGGSTSLREAFDRTLRRMSIPGIPTRSDSVRCLPGTSRSSSDLPTTTGISITGAIAMSGAVPPAKDTCDPSTTIYIPSKPKSEGGSLRPLGVSSRSLADVALIKNDADTGAANESGRFYQERSWSMSDLHNNIREASLTSANQQEPWMTNVSKEQDELRASQKESLQDWSTVLARLSSQGPQQQATTRGQHNRASSLTRLPSPILEESSGCVASSPKSLAQPAIQGPQGDRNTTVARPDPSCKHALLPSHSPTVCKVCAKPKPSGVALVAQGGRSMSFDNTAGTKSITRLSTPVDHALAPSLPESVGSSTDTLTRFPSLRNVKRASYPSAASQMLSNRPASGKRVKITELSEQAAAPPKPAKRTYTMPAPRTLTTATQPNTAIRGNPPPRDFRLEVDLSKTSTSPETNSQNVSATAKNSSSPSNITSSYENFPEKVDHVSTHRGATAGNNRLRSSAFSRDFLPASPAAAQGKHRVPLDDFCIGRNDGQIIDKILKEVDGYARRVAPASVPERDSRERRRSYSSSLTPSSVVDDSSARRAKNKAKPPLKLDIATTRRLRNSLKLWNSKSGQTRESGESEYQGYVLVMDSSGNFSTLPSATSSNGNRWDDVIPARAKTPLCELP